MKNIFVLKDNKDRVLAHLFQDEKTHYTIYRKYNKRGKLISEMIYVKNKNTNETGFYDLITKKFIVDANHTFVERTK